ncbi:BA14K family protein [Bradyrhizobium sp. WYCCWR 13022]|uniref:BA14K family protein n=1 Tax=unclassified Bradyrhizobium TaxID=2631580 RepID=UPI00263B427A|nr:BA14K family protein [Bradyrhizobium sp. WYCCWR 13022]MDN4982512.1 BA14K family protein [Bradyrhizobium sp. WYCCWR 13022]
MNSLRVLGAAAALALVLPMATPSFAQGHGGHGGGGAHFGGGGGGAHFGGGGGARMGGGSFGGGARFSGGGGNFAASAAVRPSGGATLSGGSRNFAAAGGHWNGGGGNWHGGSWHHHRGGGFWPGFAAGAAIGGLGSYAYYGGPYYGDGYYDDGYYDDGATVAVVPDTGGDSVAYCAQRYRSYDPASGTYLGYDGLRHPCP